ncbi:ArsR/SmtB family transcription factor [Longirhabdus pacifica]|uniref:ArsR/SmtB family transcription factor n=1 Tax=Longirhabdus pacifica TaxID=2305227 RepID=UPI001009312D|nr:metalloregulator ArsR/SmtB family transcription factor [Longirhabdus pacifica]
MNQDVNFSLYEDKFKALADEKRLSILREIHVRGSVCVCDLCEVVNMPQSKLSYHLKILLDAEMILKETKGTWSYYYINEQRLSELLSEKLCQQILNA